jgi:hypothetical protein
VACGLFWQKLKLAGIVRSGMASAVQKEKRLGASILRLFFHDCFVRVNLTHHLS